MSLPIPSDDLDHILAHTREIWEALRGRRVFVTGGTGFLGIWLIESFLHANERLSLNAEMAVLSRAPERFMERAPHLAGRKGLRLIAGDIRGFSLDGESFPFVIHAAANVGGRSGEASAEDVFETIVDGTRHLLDIFEHLPPERLLFVSSGAVYGCLPPGLAQVPESYSGAPDPLVPASAYGLGKRVAEHRCAVHAARCRYHLTIARCFAFVGPHLPLDGVYAAGNFLRDGLTGGPVRPAGDGTAVRSYLYAADLAIWLWTLLFRGASGRAYNVGSPNSVAIGSLSKEIAKCFGVPALEPDGARPGNQPSVYVPDVSRAEAELGLVERIPLGAAISRTVRWLLANQL